MHAATRARQMKKLLGAHRRCVALNDRGKGHAAVFLSTKEGNQL